MTAISPSIQNPAPPPEMPPKKVHFYFIDALRGIAAMWVVLFHAHLGSRLIHLEALLPQWAIAVGFEYGRLGVPIFFALSGFVIAHSLRKAKIDFPFFRHCALRRFVRLNPPYYTSIVFTLVFALFASLAKGQPLMPMEAPVSPQRLLAHLFYVQDLFGMVHFNDVYWTLCLEVQFYCVFLGLIWLAQWCERKFGRSDIGTGLFVAMAAIAASYPLGLFEIGDRPVFFLPHWHGFLLGVFAYWTWQNRLTPLMFYSYAALLLAAGLANGSAFTITCTIVAIALLEMGRSQRMHWLNQRWLQFLGHVSYSLYLTHTPVLGAVFFVGYAIAGQSLATEVLALLVGMAASLAFAALAWRLVEIPAVNWSRQLKQARAKRLKETYA